MKYLLDFYRHAVLHTPMRTLLVMLAVGVLALTQTSRFFLDASADSLILESDPELRFFRRLVSRYDSRPLVAVTVTPHDGDVFAPAALARLARMRDAVAGLPGVQSVTTLLDAPLFHNPPVPMSQAVDNLKTLADPGVDVELAREEIMNSELYRQQLVSDDGRTAVLAIFLAEDPRLAELLEERTRLWLAAEEETSPTARRQAAAQHQQLTPELRQLQKADSRQTRETLAALRQLLAPFRAETDIRLGGGPMVANDMLAFIRHDLRVFGIAIFVCIALMLKYFFGSKRWVLLALLCCCYSTLLMVGLLGLFDWPVTVISSNFVSLLLIMTMSLVIHLVVQYREIVGSHPHLELEEALSRTVAHKWIPCLFTSLTTIAGFSSLVLCDIKPVKDFGLMMSLGLVISLATSFLLFPSLLMLFRKEAAKRERDVGRPVAQSAARFVERRGRWIPLGALLAVMFIVAGVRRLTVENSFANHFRKSSDIYQGMVFIDRQLGGTTPVDVIVDLPVADTEGVEFEMDDDDMLADFDEFDEPAESETYWYTPAKLAVVRQAHAILEAQPEIGKVSSLATLLRLTDWLNGGVELDAFELAVMIRRLPPFARELLVDPYVSVADQQFRLTARIFDSDASLRRAPLLARLDHDLKQGLERQAARVRVSGTMVLYNGVLQSLFRSQILTLGTVFVLLLLMFVVLFRSLRLAVIAMFPNLISALFVLGILGVAGIPLDIMTITIASISIGIAVDDTIHYIHRFREEFQARGRYLAAMHAAHDGVGNAMYYTSVTIVVGFSLLVFSNFIPSLLFGLLTAAAMVVALAGALLLLPWLLLLVRPFGPEVTAADGA